MKKLAIDLLLFAVVGAIVLFLIFVDAHHAHGESCATSYGVRTRQAVVVRNEHAIVYPPTVAIVAQPLAVVVPQYSAQYAGLPPEVLLLLQQMGARLDSIDRQLVAPQVDPAPIVPRGSAVATPLQPAMPAAAEAPTASAPQTMPRLFARSCVNCHSAEVAKAKGNGLVLFRGRAEIALDCKVQAKILRAVERGDMPKSDKASDEEIDEVFDHYSK